MFTGAETVTSAVRGKFRDDAKTRTEALSLLMSTAPAPRLLQHVSTADLASLKYFRTPAPPLEEILAPWDPAEPTFISNRQSVTPARVLTESG